MRGSSKSGAKPTKNAGRGPNAGSVLSLLGAFAATSVALGLLVAGVFLPITGLAGTGVKSGVKLFNNMPGTFAENALSQQSKILAKDGSVIATPYDENRIVVASKDIPKVMKDAQVAIEDERFYQHGALDQRGIARAIGANLFSSGTQGASTLTQQYVKVADARAALESGNTKAAADAVSQSGTKAYMRKLKQLKYAVDLEKTHTKDQILTSYLNLVYFGDQQYGVEAAARHYFGHPAKDLTLAEAATLAGVVNLPGTTDPIHNPTAAKKRRDIVLQKMAAQGLVSQSAARAAMATPIKTHVQNFSSGCSSSKYPYYCDYVTEWVAQLPALGKTRKERLGKLKTGGLTIQTGLDPKKMKALDDSLKKHVPVGNKADVQAAGVIVEPGTGIVEAIGQNTKYDVQGEDTFNTTVNYARSGFPIGSSAKMFAIVEALRQGRAVDSTVDVPRMTGRDSAGPYAPFTKKQLPGPCGQQKGVWKVHNDEQVPAAPITLTKMTARSVNTAFAALTGQLDPCKVRNAFTMLGVTSTASGGPIQANPSAIILGADSSSPIMMANAYATMAADGRYCTPRPVSSIKRADGKLLDMHLPPCKQVLTKEQARGVVSIFKAVLKDPQATAHDSGLADGREAFGKTGTTDSSMHTWFVGATRQFSSAIWVGRGGSDQGPIKGVTIGGKHISSFLFGGDIAAPTWKEVMDTISKGLPKEKFPGPDQATLKGEQKSIPDLKGRSEADARSQLSKLKLQVSVKKQPSSEVTSGQVFRTDPAAGSQIGEGKKITLYVAQ